MTGEQIFQVITFFYLNPTELKYKPIINQNKVEVRRTDFTFEPGDVEHLVLQRQI